MFSAVNSFVEFIRRFLLPKRVPVVEICLRFMNSLRKVPDFLMSSFSKNVFIVPLRKENSSCSGNPPTENVPDILRNFLH